MGNKLLYEKINFIAINLWDQWDLLPIISPRLIISYLVCD